jgi:hypothetical protein
VISLERNQLSSIGIFGRKDDDCNIMKREDAHYCASVNHEAEYISKFKLRKARSGGKRKLEFRDDCNIDATRKKSKQRWRSIP